MMAQKPRKSAAHKRRQTIDKERARKRRWAWKKRAIERLRREHPNLTNAIAFADTYEDLIRALVEHRNRLGMSQLEVDQRAGLQDGYTGKLEIGPERPNGRGLGRMSLGLLLETYGISLAIVDRREVMRAER